MAANASVEHDPHFYFLFYGHANVAKDTGHTHTLWGRQKVGNICQGQNEINLLVAHKMLTTLTGLAYPICYTGCESVCIMVPH